MCIFWGQVSKLNSIFILSLHISSLSSRFLSSGSRANLLSRFLIILNPDFLWFWIQISSYFWIQISRRRLLTSVLLLSKVILTLWGAERGLSSEWGVHYVQVQLRRWEAFVMWEPLKEIRRSWLVASHIFLLPCSAILKPHLGHSFAKARYLSNSFKVLTVWITVNLEICLQDLNLLLCECCSHSFGLFLLHKTLRVATFIRGCEAPLQHFQVVSFAKNPVVMQSKLLPGAQLSLTAITREASQVVDLFSGPPNPVRMCNCATTLEALGTEHLVVVKLAEYISVPYKAGCMTV